MSEATGQTGGLGPFRRRLDELDAEIARLFGERFEVCREVAHYKSEHEIPMMQPERVVQVRERYLARGGEVDLPPDFTADLFELLINATCRMEDELMGTPEEERVPVRLAASRLERSRLERSRVEHPRLQRPRVGGP
ncbi:MAG TPA: chorismate mutase [Solirubrobacteraceae bacterium]|jgi:chorismate mutase|nr:chorismate mutase [Solirubrobacteraceae bacterium]